MPTRSRSITISALLALTAFASLAQPQVQAPSRRVDPPRAPTNLPDVTPETIGTALTKGVEILLALQEGENKDQWPYEGVYRVRGEIPVGYRVGGTAIVVMALAQAPGYAEDKPRQEAVSRAVHYMCQARTHADMSIDEYEAGYDVRAWGYIEALHCLCCLKGMNLIPADQADAVRDATLWYLNALQRIEMPKTGGWNYARPAGATTPGAPSPFMTGPALQALFEAKSQGFTVDDVVIRRGLDVLEKARQASGSVVYAGEPTPNDSNRTANATPGAIGRMNCAESVLTLAGRSSPDRVRGALDAFLVHWGWLDQRRAKSGTHLPPYQVAPYYFMFAHLYAAQSVELLPKGERDEYRRRLLQLLFSVRQEDGSWNDRVFARSGAYGTAVAMLVMLQPQRQPVTWTPTP